MLLILIMVLVVGITIAFIKNSKVRNYAYAVFFMLGFGLLFVLRSIMPNIGREFMESISMMPQINELLTAASIATLLIVPMSIYLGYKLYLSPAQKSCE